MDFLLVGSTGSTMCLIRFIFSYLHGGGKLRLSCQFLKGGNEGPKGLGDLLGSASRLTAKPSKKLRLPTLTSVFFNSVIVLERSS